MSGRAGLVPGMRSLLSGVASFGELGQVHVSLASLGISRATKQTAAFRLRQAAVFLLKGFDAVPGMLFQAIWGH